MGALKRIWLVLLLVVVSLGWLGAKPVQARIIIDDNWAYVGQPEDSEGNCQLTGDAIVPDYYCNRAGLSKPADDCVQNPWIFYYNAECVGESLGPDQGCSYQYGWHQSVCSTADSCVDSEHGLRPGICDASRGGCTIGTQIYKTCCNGAYSEPCTGGDHTGVCPHEHVWGTGADDDCYDNAPPPTPGGGGGGCTGGWDDNSGHHQCSDWNNNPSGCWANGQFNGQPSCVYCSDNTCRCGSCPGGGSCPGRCEQPGHSLSSPIQVIRNWQKYQQGSTRCRSFAPRRVRGFYLLPGSLYSFSSTASASTASPSMSRPLSGVLRNSL